MVIQRMRDAASVTMIETRWQDLGPNEAAQIIEHWVFPRQRTVRPRRVLHLARLMRNGEFAPSEIKVAILPDGRHMLLNGQHRVRAVVESGCTILVGLTTIHVEDQAMVEMLYSAEDRQGPRTINDIFIGLGLDDKLSFSRPLVNRAGAALRVIASGFDSSRNSNFQVSDIRRGDLIVEWADTIRRWDEVIGSPGHTRGSSNRVNVSGVMSVGLVTFRYQPIIAMPFWKAVRDDSGLIKGTTERRMVDYITRDMDATSCQPATAARSVAAIWNAHFKGRGGISRPAPTGVPITIAGTPYNGLDLIYSDVDPPEVRRPGAQQR